MSANLFHGIKRCLVVAAHPDDEILGVGATIAKLIDQGVEVAIIHGTGGKGGRTSAENSSSQQISAEQATIAKEAREVRELLGVKHYCQLGLPDNRMDTVSRMDIAQGISEFSNDFGPDVVFTHHSGDYNWDHGLIYDACLMSFRANAGSHYPNMLISYEVLSSSERSAQNPNNIFCPNLFVNIENYLDKKIAALKLYQSELNPYPHPRSPEAVEYLARKRGQEVGVQLAEAFQVVRLIQ